MPGSVANPVRLQNPFRKIVEVHWNPARFLTFQILVNRTLSYAFADSPSCPAFPSVPPAWDVARQEVTYATSAVVDYYGGAATGFKLLRENAWQSITASLTGLPTDLPETFTYAFESTVAEVRIGPDPRSIWPRGRWQDATGGDISYDFGGSTVPVVTPSGGLTFKAGTDTAFEIYGNIWTDPLACWDVTSYGGTAGPQTRIGLRTDTYNHVISSHAFSLAGMSVPYRTRSYVPIGFRFEPNVAFEPLTAGILHVLCERQTTSG